MGGGKRRTPRLNPGGWVEAILRASLDSTSASFAALRRLRMTRELAPLQGCNTFLTPSNPPRKVRRMEIPSKVSIFNRTLELKGKPGTLIAVNDHGFYEVSLDFQQRLHTVLFPIAETVLIFNEPLPAASTDFEVER
jgi:hypothetical protein